MDKQSVPRYLPEQRHECLFNPPHTSSFGGALERQIGTIGRTLDAMLLELCTYQCKSRGGGGGVQARGGDLMPETIPLSGF